MDKYRIVQINKNSEPVPWYLDDLTWAQIGYYYFNWHDKQLEATSKEIEKWFKEKRGWMWKKI